MPIQNSISNAIKGDAPLGGVTPPFNQYSFEFDGSIDFISVADNSNLSFGNGTSDSPFSISCWAKVTQLSTGHSLFRKRGDSTALYNWEYDMFISSTGIIYFRLFDVGSVIRVGRITNAGLINTNTWYNIVATYDGRGGSTAYDGMKIYLNGVRVDNANTSNNTYTAMHNLSAPVSIGKFTTGNIDEVAVWDSALTDGGVSVGQPAGEQIAEIYNGGVPNDLSSLSPISWWRMGDAATWTGRNWDLIDQGSGSNNGFSDTIPGPPSAPSTDIPT